MIIALCTDAYCLSDIYTCDFSNSTFSGNSILQLVDDTSLCDTPDEIYESGFKNHVHYNIIIMI